MYPDAPCMEYLPTFSISSSQIPPEVNRVDGYVLKGSLWKPRDMLSHSTEWLRLMDSNYMTRKSLDAESAQRCVPQKPGNKLNPAETRPFQNNGQGEKNSGHPAKTWGGIRNTLSHRIHATGISTYIFLMFMVPVYGKYTVRPMELYGNCTRPVLRFRVWIQIQTNTTIDRDIQGWLFDTMFRQKDTSSCH